MTDIYSFDESSPFQLRERARASEPVPGIAHGSIPGLLGVALNDRMRAAQFDESSPFQLRAQAAGGNGLSAPPTRTDAPADGGAQVPGPALPPPGPPAGGG